MPPKQAAPSSTDVAIPGAGTSLELAYRAIIHDDLDPGLLAQEDPEAISRRIMEGIMLAETFEEAFSPQSLPAWREKYMDVPVKVTGIHFNRSTIEGGKGAPIYAVVDLVDATSGVVDTVSCGGRNVLVQLVKMLERGWTDRVVKMTDKTTGEGYKVLWLEAVPMGR